MAALLKMENEIIHGTRCIVTIAKKKAEIAMCTGSRQRFCGKTRAEAELQLWNYLHCRPRMRGETSITEEHVKALLRTLDMPEERVRISSEHYKQNQVYRNSFAVRRSIGMDGKIYFGTYHNEHAAKAASIRLCELINEEIDRRIIVRKSTVPEGFPLKRKGGSHWAKRQVPVMERQTSPASTHFDNKEQRVNNA